MGRVLVTGGAGFVGYHLVKRLIEEGHEVNVLDDFSSGQSENILPGSKLFKGDICDDGLLSQAVKNCQLIFHLAARVEIQSTLQIPSETFRVNIAGTAKVIEKALELKARLIFASSCSVYPLHPQKPLSENMATLGETPYALSKASSEKALEIFRKLKGLNVIALRFFNIYGPRQRPDSPYSAVIPKFFYLALKGKPLTIFGKGSQSRDFVHVNDAVDAYLLAAASEKGGIYNIGSGKDTKIIDLAQKIILLCAKGRIEHLPPVPLDASFSRGDIRRARKELGFAPKVDLEKGLREVFDYLRRG
jgi:UDP-glucose 4-epimerase